MFTEYRDLPQWSENQTEAAGFASIDNGIGFWGLLPEEQIIPLLQDLTGTLLKQNQVR